MDNRGQKFMPKLSQGNKIDIFYAELLRSVHVPLIDSFLNEYKVFLNVSISSFIR